MSISKNFVIKHGLEVSTDLIIADAVTRKVGVGTTAAQYTLHVNGGIGVTNAYVSGIGTFIDELNVGLGGTVLTVLGLGNSIGIGTANPAFLLDIRSPVSTGQTALYVQGDVRITGDLSVDDISITNLNVSGVSTFFGFATFQDYVFIQDGLNVTGAGATLASLNVLGVSTFVGFATFSNNIFVSGIGTVTTLNSTSGTITNLVSTSGTITNLVSTSGTITNLTGTNVSYNGISTLGTVQISSGIITATSGIVTYFGDGSYLTGTASLPNLQSVLNTGNTSTIGMSVVGIVTATSFVGDGSGLTGVGIGSTGSISTSGIITATSFVGALTGTATSTTNIPNLTGDITSANTVTTLATVNSNVGSFGSGGAIPTITVNAKGLVTGVTTTSVNPANDGTLTLAVSGTGLSGSASFTANQSGASSFTVTSNATSANTVSTIVARDSSGNFTAGTITATDFNSTSDINLKENIHTIVNALETISTLRGVSFGWKETGRNSYGVIAQELQEILPDLVNTGEVKSVNYNGIIGVLIEAVKELKKEVEELKKTK